MTMDGYRRAMERTAKFHGYIPPRPFTVAPSTPVIRRPRKLKPLPFPKPSKKYTFIGPYLIPTFAKRNVPVATIQADVAAHFHVLAETMTSPSRAREVSRPRQVSMYLSRMLTPRSLPEIGRLHGHRDHTTVMHAVRTITRLRSEDPEFDEHVLAIARGWQ